ncbi:MAG: glycosyl hydrolase family 18 protein [Acetatifactor sp.]
MKKVIPVIIAILLILIIGAAAFGKKILDKYSYGKEYADLDEYYGVENASVDGADGMLAIVLQDELVEELALVINGRVYFDFDTVQKYFNDGFYTDFNEQMLLYTSAVDTVQVMIGEKVYSDREGAHDTEFEICVMKNDKLYLAADFVKLFANFSYEKYDRHMQVYTEWGVKKTFDIAKDTQLRVQGGIKSPILKDMKVGDTVEVLEQMETWSKVKTADSMIGYIENKRLTNMNTEVETPVTDWKPEEYTTVRLEGKVNLGWHAIYSTGGNDTLDTVVAEGKGINVIAPTWFSLKDAEGTFESFASAGYVEKAHKYGLKVWGVWDDFNYCLNNGVPFVDTYEIFSHTTKRRALAENIVATAKELGLDGINLDFEKLTAETRGHFNQFLRELSVLCRSEGLTLSVDNYVPLNSNNTLRFDVQGKVTDYVIMMGYDEHWGGCGEAGSVASIGYVSGGLDRLLEQMPAEKIINAVPLYTRVWKTEGTKVTDEAITLNNLSKYIESTGRSEEVVWDETTCQNYLEWKDGEVTYQIWLEDLESLKVKLNVMTTKGIGGVAAWRLGYGTPEIWQLLAAYAKTR